MSHMPFLQTEIHWVLWIYTYQSKSSKYKDWWNKNEILTMIPLLEFFFFLGVYKKLTWDSIITVEVLTT